MAPQFPPTSNNKKHTILKAEELPNWFDLKNYQHANKLDLEGWVVQLHLRQMIQGFFLEVVLTGIVDDYQLSLDTKSNAPREPVSPISLQDALLITEGVKNTIAIPTESWQAPSHFNFLEQSDNIIDTESLLSWLHNTDGKRSPKDFYLASHTPGHLLRPFLKIDLTTPDSIILDSFKRWLAKERKLLSRRRIQKFTKATLQRWAINQLLPYIDLTHWANLNAKQIPYWLMGKVLFPGQNQGDTTDRVRQTTEKAAKEILTDSYIQTIAAQLTEQTGKKLNLNTSLEEFEDLRTKHKIHIKKR